MLEFVSVAQARELVLLHARPGPVESVSLSAAVGRVLRQPVVARENTPPFDNSAMDGYAVRSADLQNVPADLRIVADIPAGSSEKPVIHSGTCARIMTGAPFPSGADAVVPVEWTSGFAPVGREVTVSRSPIAGQHVRRAGEDVSVGTTVLESGHRILSTTIGTLASLGYAEVEVGTRPTVSIVATGSELVDPSQALGPGQIRNSNGPALRALSERAGAAVVDELQAPDAVEQTASMFRRALESDIVLISGGVSVGERDLVKETLADLGVSFHFWKVRQRPGKPLAFGTRDSTLVFGLPGNPVSTTICFVQYAQPAIARILGAGATGETFPATLRGKLKKAPGLHHFIPAVTTFDDSGGAVVRASGPQGSHVYSSVTAANSIIHLGEELQAAPADGSLVTVERLGA